MASLPTITPSHKELPIRFAKYSTCPKISDVFSQRWKKPSIWRTMPQKANGIIITGALSTEEILEAVSATVPVGETARRVVALVPAELWRVIIYHATETYPVPFSVRDLHALPPTTNLSEEELHQLYLQSISIKLKLSRVCQAWKILAKEVLFEFVWITSLKGANALGRLFADEADAGRALAESSGWWIRKLWLDGFPPNGSSRYKVRLPEVESNYSPLISKCPRLLHYRHRSSYTKRPRICVPTLEALVYQSPPSSAHPYKHPANDIAAEHDLSLSSLPETASHRHQHGLTSLEWYDSKPRSFVAHLERHSAVLSHSILASLQSLTVRADYYVPPDITGHKNHVIHLPMLQALAVTDVKRLADLTEWDLPALRSLSVAGSLRGVNYLESFLRAHGADIEVLEILDLGRAFYSSSQRGDNALQLDVTQMCPNLTTLHLSLKDLEHWSRNRTFWAQTSRSSVRRLGLFGLEGYASQLPSTDLVDQFREMNWEESLPALEILQDMSIKSDRLRRRSIERPELSEARPHIAFWKMLVEVLADRGVTVLDWNGGPVMI